MSNRGGDRVPRRGNHPSPRSRESGQGLVEYALILALVVLVVIVALLATGGQVRNLYSDIITTMCNNHVGC